MDQKTKAKLLKTIEICENLIAGRPFHVANSEIGCIPSYLNAMSPTAAKKRNMVLKQRAKPIGTMEWQLPSAGAAFGELYLGKSYKLCPKLNKKAIDKIAARTGIRLDEHLNNQ